MLLCQLFIAISRPIDPNDSLKPNALFTLITSSTPLLRDFSLCSQTNKMENSRGVGNAMKMPLHSYTQVYTLKILPKILNLKLTLSDLLIEVIPVSNLWFWISSDISSTVQVWTKNGFIMFSNSDSLIYWSFQIRFQTLTCFLLLFYWY